MALAGESRHGMWSNKWLFVLAAAGSAVGLGNIWKFPYIAGENGGGAFVLVYLACVFLIGIPIMMSEVLIGRHARQSPINAVRSLVAESKASSFWVLIGWMGVLAGFLILSFYAVIAGWALHYGWLMGVGTFQGADGAMAGATFDAFLANPWMLLGYQTLFMVVTIWIVSRGVIKGLETAIRWFMPMLFVLLLVLLAYGVTSGGFPQAVEFMFGFHWDALSWDGVLVAMGQAFFTLSLGMGAIMAYGAYLPDDASIPGTVTTIALLDTFVAVAAGLVVFSIVFANDLDPSSGPGLMFVTIPLALGSLPAGEIFGVVFFVLVTFAAITSAISLTEPALAYLVEEYNAKRGRVAVSLGVICWLLGIGSVLSFNVWADVHIVGSLTFFDFVDYISQNIMLPLGGLLIVLFAAFVLPRSLVRKQVGFDGGIGELLWLLLARVVAPIGVLTVFVYTLYKSFA